MKKYIKRGVIALGILLMLLVLLAGAALAWLQTESGQKYLESTLNRVLVWEDGRVEIRGISGVIPFNFQVQNIEIHDKDGAWLEVQDSELEWSWRDLLQARMVIKKLGAAALYMSRTPHTEPMEEPEVPDELKEKLEWKWPLPPLIVESLYLDRARIGEEVLGQEAEFFMQGALSAYQRGFAVDGLNISRLDRDETSLDISMDFSHNSHELEIYLRFFDSATLPELLPAEEIPDSLELVLEGRGPVQDWPGKLTVRGGDLLDLAMDINLKLLEESLELAVGAEASISPAIAPDPLDFYLKHPLHLKTQLSMDYSENLVSLRSLHLDSEHFSLDSRAELVLDEMFMQGSADMLVKDLNPLLEKAEFNSGSPAEMKADFHGPVTSPAGKVNLRLEGLKGHDLHLESLYLQADLEYPGEVNGTKALARGRIMLQGLGFEHYPQLPGEMEIGFNVDYADSGLVDLKELRLVSRDLEALVRGRIDLEDQGFEATLESRVFALENLMPEEAADLELAGSLNFKADTYGNIADETYNLQLSLSGEELSSGQELLNALVGEKPVLTAAASMSEPDILKLEELELITREAAFVASGLVDLKKMDMDMVAGLDMESLEFLGAALNREMAGSLSAKATARGGPEDLELNLDADLAGLKPGADLDLMDIQASLNSVYTRERFSGKVQASLDSEPGRVELGSDFELVEKNLKVANLFLSGFDSSVRGDLELDLDTFLAQGALDVDVPELNAFAGMAGLEIYGDLQGSISLDKTQDRQDGTLDFQAMDMVLDSMSVVYLELAGQGQDLFAGRNYNVELNLAGLDLGEAYLSSWETVVQGQDTDLSLSTSLDGRAVYPLELKADASYSLDRGDHIIGLDLMQGRFAYEDFSLLKPFRVKMGDGEINISPGELAWGDGRMTFHGGLSSEEVLFEAELHDILLSQIPLEAFEVIEGRLGGEFKVQGNPARPVAKAGIGLRELRALHPDMDDMPHLDVSADLLLEDGAVQIKAALLQGPDELLGLDLSLPAVFSLEPAVFELQDPASLQGRLVSTLELGEVAPLFLPPDMTLTGLLQSEVDISGTLQEPVLDGQIELDDGVFEHTIAGVYLKDINALIRARNEQVLLEKLTASDGEAGRIRGSGSLDLDPEVNMPWDFDLQIQDANILRHPLAMVNITSCDLELSGDTTRASVKGALTFGRIDARLPPGSPPEVVHLDVTEKNKPPSDLPPPPRQLDMEAYPVDLDLELNFPARVYVRGRGLDSEWGGYLYIDGKAHEPRIRGELSPVRGRFTFLDRRFDLDRDSQVYLDGAYPPDPTLDMRAHYRQRDRNITVRIHGRALSPALDLESDPPMHEDEILAWILFGRDLSDLTPFQALTLLNAARTLATGEAGPGVMDQIRSLVGVDDIQVTRDDEGELQFGLGRYVHERVYMQVKKGTAPGTDQVAVEIELTPRISLEGSMETDADGGVFLFWKRDY
ncbi:translocation/assembly module TamB domain-containing protein [Desulfonatronospira sp.]|uniref:translocation/assembly module TamB domain-containing protein n=1 Tax=Desulfonatronospira sp. TaxID=1962951 RepID=UPI0025BA34A4|nr:translocation/assembly module TamB domain-containing protein [Desulfonatronospira sp.]